MRTLLLLCSLFLTRLPVCPAQLPVPPHREIVVGAARMEAYLPLLAGKQAGLVVNHSSRVGNRHLADTLASSGICIARIYTPEHGFRGTAPDGAYIQDGTDADTGAPIISLYGKNRYPTPEDLAGIEIMVFDIQDVGTRFYTYISTLYNILDACANQQIPVLVLDRPNPNGHYVDGPVLDMRLRSFVGIAPLPVVHGCTVGELARLFTGEYWTGPNPPPLVVIPCLYYTHQTPYDLPVAPSPNLPNQRAVLLYPSLCFFEGTEVSVGRGTDWPFQVIGHPDFPDTTQITFAPQPNAGSRYPPQQGRECHGYDFRYISADSLYRQGRIDLTPLLDFYSILPGKENFFLPNKYFNKLAGTYTLWQQIEYGCSEPEIRETWQDDLDCFLAIRKKYLLYPDNIYD